MGFFGQGRDIFPIDFHIPPQGYDLVQRFAEIKPDKIESGKTGKKKREVSESGKALKSKWLQKTDKTRRKFYILGFAFNVAWLIEWSDDP